MNYIYNGPGLGAAVTKDEDGQPVFSEQRVKLELTTSGETKISSSSLKAGGTSNGFYSEIGELTLQVNDSGSGFKDYVPGTIINIKPGATHVVRATIKVSHGAYAGNIIGYINPLRGAPIATATPVPTATTTPAPTAGK
jgi:hypothetical protein